MDWLMFSKFVVSCSAAVVRLQSFMLVILLTKNYHLANCLADCLLHTDLTVFCLGLAISDPNNGVSIEN